jgi:hypothetical protein
LKQLLKNLSTELLIVATTPYIFTSSSSSPQYTVPFYMPMHTPATSPSILACMPKGYLSALSRMTGLKTITNLSQIVRLEQTSSKHWPAVEQLAQQTSPELFAKWQAANAPEVAAS